MASPEQFALTPTDLSAWAAQAQVSAPLGMTTLSTHDTKRGEDTRARLGVLSELPREWSALVDALRAASAPYRSALLDGRTEYLLWQTLAGTWTDQGPIAADRLTEYLTKAIREAKSRTTWTAPDEPYEARACSTPRGRRWSTRWSPGCSSGWELRTRAAVRAADARHQAGPARRCPGSRTSTRAPRCPTRSLVDPDNRRPVDARTAGRPPGPARRRRRSARPGRREAAGHVPRAAAAPDLPGGVRRPDSGFLPLAHSSGHSLTYARTVDGDPQVAVVATRLAAAVDRLGGWADHTVALPDGDWHDVLTDRPVTGASSTSAACSTGCPSPCSSGRRAEPMLPRVWAPNAVDASTCVVETRRAHGAGPTPGGRPTGVAPAGHRLRVLARRRPAATRPPQRVAARTACTARAASSTPPRSPGPTTAWAGADVRGAVLYELHVGTFTAEGTLESAAAERLDHWSTLGVDMVELMPVAAVRRRPRLGLRRRRPLRGARARTAGRRPCSGSSTPRTAWASACASTSSTTTSARRGAYVGEFGPYWTDAHAHPVGRGDQPRPAGFRRGPALDHRQRAAAGCADFHVDALRLDAVHALADDRPVHLLAQLSDRVARPVVTLGRPLSLIAETDLNDTVSSPRPPRAAGA